MKVSLIIPTFNSFKRLPRLLSAVQGQTCVPNQILVVDSSSDDATVQIASDYGAEVLTVKREAFDHGGTRSMAGRIATGDIIVYMTDDALPVDNSVFEKLLEVFRDADVGAAYIRQLPYLGTSAFAAHLRQFNYPDVSQLKDYSQKWLYGIKTPFLSNSFCGYRRKALEQVGWFKEKLILGEDVLAGASLLKAGYKLYYRADAAVYHSHDYTAFQEARRYFDIGVFHESEKWILEDFGGAQGEGLKYVFSGIKSLLRSGNTLGCFDFLFRAGLKFLYYRLGRKHHWLPVRLVRKMSMHCAWWKV